MTKKMTIVLDGKAIPITDFEFMPYQEAFVKAITNPNFTVILHTIATDRVSIVRKLKACFDGNVFPIVVPSLPSIETMNKQLLMRKDFGTNKNVQNTYGWYRSFEKKRFARGMK